MSYHKLGNEQAANVSVNDQLMPIHMEDATKSSYWETEEEKDVGHGKRIMLMRTAKIY
jgi:hypothetical protein